MNTENSGWAKKGCQSLTLAGNIVPKSAKSALPNCALPKSHNIPMGIMLNACYVNLVHAQAAVMVHGIVHHCESHCIMPLALGSPVKETCLAHFERRVALD